MKFVESIGEQKRKAILANFCIVDDIEKSENKHDFSSKERKKLSEEGEAMSDGSFPIRNSQDLKDAIRSVGRASNPQSAKQWIKKRAKQLDLENLLPESWDEEIDELEKGNKFNTSHLVLKEVDVNGKMQHRWVDPNKNNQEHAEHGSRVELEHKGVRVKGTVGSVGKTGEYAIKLDKEHGGNTINKHPHQFQSPHEPNEQTKESKQAVPEEKMASTQAKNFAEETPTHKLEEYVGNESNPQHLRNIAQKELDKRSSGQSNKGESENSKNTQKNDKATNSKQTTESVDKAAAKIAGESEKQLQEDEEGKSDINRRFRTYERFARSIATGKGGMKSMIAYGSGGVGKAQPLYSKVLTDKGFVQMSEINVGDNVVTPSGKLSKVLQVFPQEGLRPVYELTFIDGSKVRCDEEHIWVVKNRKNTKKGVEWKEMTTKQIMDIGVKSSDKRGWGWNFGVPFISKVFDNGDINLPLHPWMMGFLLGDGSLINAVHFSVGKRDKDFVVDKLLDIIPNETEIVKYKTGCDYGIAKVDKSNTNVSNPITSILKQLELYGLKSSDKFIPKLYLEASANQKLELIQGLMDSDGYVREDGCSSFSTTSEQLAKDFYDLVKSFGGFANIKNRKAGTYKHKGESRIGKPGFDVNFYLPKDYIPVTLPYKVERYKNKKHYSQALSIIDISYVGEEETKCILIDDEEHLYITDNYIVTHNTHTAVEELRKAGKREFKEGMEIGSDDYDYVKVTGKATTAGIYQAMYEHNGKILLFDDCDSAITDTDEGLFKGALDTSGDGTIAYSTQRPLKDSNGNPIPNRFSFNGRCMFISNLPANKVPQPLKSRSLRIDMSMTPEQTIDRIKHIAKDKDSGEYNNLEFKDSEGKPLKYTHAEMNDVINFLDKYKNKTNDLNIRTVGSLLTIMHEVKSDGGDKEDWEHDAKAMLFSKSFENHIVKSLEALQDDELEKDIRIERMNEVEKALDVIGVFDENDLEKGHRDTFHLEKKIITNKNGHQQTVYVRTNKETGSKHEFTHEDKVSFEHKGEKVVGHIKKLKHHEKYDPFGTAEIHDEKGNKYSKSLRAIEHHNGDISKQGKSPSEMSKKDAEKIKQEKKEWGGEAPKTSKEAKEFAEKNKDNIDKIKQNKSISEMSDKERIVYYKEQKKQADDKIKEWSGNAYIAAHKANDIKALKRYSKTMTDMVNQTQKKINETGEKDTKSEKHTDWLKQLKGGKTLVFNDMNGKPMEVSLDQSTGAVTGLKIKQEGKTVSNKIMTERQIESYLFGLEQDKQEPKSYDTSRTRLSKNELLNIHKHKQQLQATKLKQADRKEKREQDKRSKDIPAITGKVPNHLPEGHFEVTNDFKIGGGAWQMKFKAGTLLRSDGNGTLEAYDNEKKEWKRRKPPIEGTTKLEFNKYIQHEGNSMYNAFAKNTRGAESSSI